MPKPEPDLLQGMSVENLLSEAQAATRHLGQLGRLEAARKRGGAPRADLGPILAVVVLLILGPDMARLDVLEALQTASQHELPIREAVARAYAVGLEEGGGLEASTDGGTNAEIQSLQASLAQAQEMWATAIEQQKEPRQTGL